ncbi:cytochrome P450-dit2 [Apophysomyces sp. BC1034]|nr:cytochrome P450-dit2 [Apophysomyces sp. BC1021]KAG0192729.1 cytochrome P450-dit2 [Apophysomyces sp. BC1034]
MPVKTFGSVAQKLFNILATQDKTVDIGNFMDRVSLDAIGKVGFGFEFNAVEDPNNHWVRIYHDIDNGMRDPLFAHFPFLDHPALVWMFPARKDLHRRLDSFMDMLMEVVKNKRRLLEKNEEEQVEVHERDLLTLMIQSAPDEKSGLNDEELKNNMKLFFLGGQSTTSNALAFITYYLATNKDVQEKARKEANEILGDEMRDIIPTVEQLKKMKYIDMIIKEVLRISPPATQIIPRRATEDVDIGGYFIPKNTVLVADIYDIHHNPAIWKDPETFNPDRFLPDGEADKLSGAWLTFSSVRKYTWALSEDSKHKDKLRTTMGDLVVPIDLKITLTERY